MHPVHTSEVPFPAVAMRLEGEYQTAGLRLRRFGSSAADLEIDFDAAPGPHVTTELLSACTVRPSGSPAPAEFYWRLDVSTRIECLLRLAFLESNAPLWFPLRCPRPDCEQSIEIALEAEQLLASARSDTESFEVPGPRGLAVRRPRGSDQLRWLHEAMADEPATIAALARTLIVEGDAEGLTAADVRRIEQCLDENDPLLEFEATVACPYCGQSSEHELDITAAAIGRLKQAQRRLIESIHLLASRYHWSESEILDLPAWRRAQYLALAETL